MMGAVWCSIGRVLDGVDPRGKSDVMTILPLYRNTKINYICISKKLFQKTYIVWV